MGREWGGRIFFFNFACITLLKLYMNFYLNIYLVEYNKFHKLINIK